VFALRGVPEKKDCRYHSWAGTLCTVVGLTEDMCSSLPYGFGRHQYIKNYHVDFISKNRSSEGVGRVKCPRECSPATARLFVHHSAASVTSVVNAYEHGRGLANLQTYAVSSPLMRSGTLVVAT
jgi:hypothetical protein